MQFFTIFVLSLTLRLLLAVNEMQPKPHFRAIMLVLASDNKDIYRECRRVWQTYMHKEPSIKVFLLYGKGTNFTRHSYDLVYDDIVENYNPGMLQKTVRAMEDICNEYTFDYFIRTNISTFWDFLALLKHLAVLPTKLCYSGDGTIIDGKFDGFGGKYLSGTDTIVNMEMVEEMVRQKDILNYVVPEDEAMGLFFHGRLGAKFLKSRIHFMEKINPNRTEIQAEVLIGVSSGADHYRVKNVNPKLRMRVDVMVFKQLLHSIYNEKLLLNSTR